MTYKEEALKGTSKPDIIVHACNPGLQRLMLEDHKFKASLG
jgi:hypothetical protein